ncbi:hypothetical protein [Actinoplanes sp. NPDC026623]
MTLTLTVPETLAPFFGALVIETVGALLSAMTASAATTPSSVARATTS